MNWIIASLILFISSVILYLFVRKSQLMKIPNAFNNLAMFAVPAIIYLIMAVYQHNSIVLSGKHLLLTLFSAFFFSYLGNVFSLTSIQSAPNPGYSLIISKSYVVFTTLVAVLIFGSKLTIKNAIAIICIVAFSALIMISKSHVKKNTNKKWILYACGAFFAWGFLALMSKYLITDGIQIPVYLFYLSLFVSLMITGEIILKKVPIKGILNTSTYVVLLGIGIASMFFNLFIQVGYKLAPNPGYINAANASSISLVTLLSAYFYKDELTLRKIVGVLGVTAGLVLLFV